MGAGLVIANVEGRGRAKLMNIAAALDDRHPAHAW
jgi:hypothetical protein